MYTLNIIIFKLVYNFNWFFFVFIINYRNWYPTKLFLRKSKLLYWLLTLANNKIRSNPAFYQVEKVFDYNEWCISTVLKQTVRFFIKKIPDKILIIVSIWKNWENTFSNYIILNLD